MKIKYEDFEYVCVCAGLVFIFLILIGIPFYYYQTSSYSEDIELTISGKGTFDGDTKQENEWYSTGYFFSAEGYGIMNWIKCTRMTYENIEIGKTYKFRLYKRNRDGKPLWAQQLIKK